MEELYRFYCYPVYAFIRRRGHARYDAQDLTQDFFVHLLENGILGWPIPSAAGSAISCSAHWGIS
jgi:DNA-directed RNA polymerase specialized sigma24 family protein